MMAGDGASLLRASDFAAAITFVAADDRVEKDLARRRRRRAAANGDRDDDDVACGWSSAVAERGLALRRRRGGSGAAAASCCSRLRGGLVVRAAGEERGCRGEDAAAYGALGIGAEAAVGKKPVTMIDPVAFLCLAIL
ncbi:unnamed protein product [Urochloa humidicola]